MNPLPKAREIWDSPSQMVMQWYSDTEKLRQEMIIAKLVGSAGYLVDVGCGVGRFAEVMQCDKYQGYDLSTAMVALARQRNGKRGEFACVDAVSFQPDTQFDTLISIDTAIHQTDPITFIQKIRQNFKAKRYYFSLIVGDHRQDLFASTVVSKDNLKAFNQNWKVVYTEPVKNENYEWMILEYKTG